MVRFLPEDPKDLMDRVVRGLTVACIDDEMVNFGTSHQLPRLVPFNGFVHRALCENQIAIHIRGAKNHTNVL